VWPFAGTHPRRNLAGARKRRVIQTRRRIEPATRVPGTPRGGHARHRQERAARLRSSVPTRDPLLRASGTRRAKAGVCGWRLAGPRCGNASAAANATGIGWCQRVARRKPHSRARIDGSSGVPVRRIRLQKSANVVEVQRSVSPAGCGARGQGPSSHGLRKEARGSAKASITSTAVAKPRSRGRPEPGAREGVAGQRFSSDGRHPRSFIGSFVHADGSRAVSAALAELMNARASRETRGRRQGCQRLGPHASRREDNARHDDSFEGNTCDPLKRIALS